MPSYSSEVGHSVGLGISQDFFKAGVEMQWEKMDRKMPASSPHTVMAKELKLFSTKTQLY